MKRKSRDNSLGSKLLSFFDTLMLNFGPQYWWPANTPFEVVIGAILTQNTLWNNVEKAIANLKKNDLIYPDSLVSLDDSDLAMLIKPAGYFNIKTKRIKAFLTFLLDEYRGELNKLFQDDTLIVRDKLLNINGIGPETADSILLYAGGHPIFVVDAYTKRIMARHGIIFNGASYDDVQALFMSYLPIDAQLFNEYHALLVKVGKDYCRKKEPRCAECPLNIYPLSMQKSPAS